MQKYESLKVYIFDILKITLSITRLLTTVKISDKPKDIVLL